MPRTHAAILGWPLPRAAGYLSRMDHGRRSFRPAASRTVRGRLLRVRASCAILLAVPLLASGCRAERLPELGAAELRSTGQGGTTAGYFSLKNPGPDTLLVDSITLGVARLIEVHETTIDSSGVARMRPVGKLTVPPDSTVTLRPGGLHLMVMDVTRELRAGEQIPMTVWLSDGHGLVTAASVR